MLTSLKEKEEDMISGINNRNMKCGVCNYRLKAVDPKISRRDLEDLESQNKR